MASIHETAEGLARIWRQPLQIHCSPRQQQRNKVREIVSSLREQRKAVGAQSSDYQEDDVRQCDYESDLQHAFGGGAPGVAAVKVHIP